MTFIITIMKKVIKVCCLDTIRIYLVLMLKWNSPPVTDIDDQGLPQSAMVYQGLIISLVTIRTAQYFLSMCFNYIQTSEHLKFGMILPVFMHFEPLDILLSILLRVIYCFTWWLFCYMKWHLASFSETMLHVVVF